ncbi:MAG: CAP domain-containing protein [Microcoleaceae cyanobacterium]
MLKNLWTITVITSILVLSQRYLPNQLGSIFRPQNPQPISNSQDESQPTNMAQTAPFSDLEKLTHQKVNEYRASKNLPPLEFSAQISQQSRIHSQAMAEGKVAFSHAGFEQRAEKLSQPIPYREIAENVAYNSGYSNPAAEAVEGWIDSSGHRKNMEGNYNLTGIGIAKNSAGEYYFTQIFIRSR